MSLLRPERVLVPVDVPEIACEALEEALRLVDRPTRLHVLHVVPAVEQDAAISWGTIDGESREAYALRDLRSRLAGSSFADAELHVAFGDASSEIVVTAEEVDAELILMATHGRTGLSRLISGSVTEKVIRSAPCPVLVLPARVLMPA